MFGPDAIDGRSTLRLCLPDAWVDLEAAIEAIHRAESAVAQDEWTRAWGPVLAALFVAERDFLPGEDAPWIDDIRHQLDRAAPASTRSATPQPSSASAEPSSPAPSGPDANSSTSPRCAKAATATSCKPSPPKTTWPKLSTSTASSATASATNSASHPAPPLANFLRATPRRDVIANDRTAATLPPSDRSTRGVNSCKHLIPFNDYWLRGHPDIGLQGAAAREWLSSANFRPPRVSHFDGA